MTDWIKQLNKATYRGVPFGVFGSELAVGRRVAVHEYPGKDKPYIEDMGRGTRRISMVGFLVSNSLVYGGGDVRNQRDQMVSAAEKEGAGLMVHPSMGLLNVSIPEGGLRVVEKWDNGPYYELHFSFIESGFKQFANVAASSTSLLDTLVAKLGISSLSDFVSSCESAVSQVYSAVQAVEGEINSALDTVESVIDMASSAVSSVINTVADFQVMVSTVMHDVSTVTSLASKLTGGVSGLFGIYNTGSSSSAYSSKTSTAEVKSSSVTTASIATELAAAITDSVEQREATTAAATAFTDAAAAFDGSSVEDFGTAAQTLVSTLAAGISDPADAIRLLSTLSDFTVSDFSSASQVGQARTVAQYVTATLLRRAVIAEMATAVSTYAPASYDDAIAVRDQVVAILDAEILIAGDLGDDDSYGSLRDVRSAIVTDLNARGADLAGLQTYTLRAALPSLVVANRIYGDPSRSTELIEQTTPVHPAFMPTSFRALSE